MHDRLAQKQLEFVLNCTARWNLAHGSVRSGKTIGTLFGFMHAVSQCPDSDIYMIGKTSKTIFRNAIKLLFFEPVFSIFKPYCTWQTGQLSFLDKKIIALGAKDEGAIGVIQGLTMSLCYCDEMTLYPTSVIEMINSRLSRSYSKGFASMNPSYPDHILKKWIDAGLEGNPDYYSLHFTLDDNPFLEQSYKDSIKFSASGIFYKRNYLGLWCLAEGAIFDFFEDRYYVVDRPPKAAHYWIAGIDYGTSNNFACLLIGINTGQADQTGISRWVEKEYVWDSHKMHRQKTNSEYATDVAKFLEGYDVKTIYIDPSAASFKVDLRRRGFHVIDADNEVLDGINYLHSEMKAGSVLICKECINTIREIKSYVWHPKCLERGEDEPLKQNDHCVDALRYAIKSHKPSVYDYEADRTRQKEYMRNRFAKTSVF
jgi:PBSX family phage terminase large subunit